MNYLYSQVRDAASNLSRSDDVKRRAFAVVLEKVATALHDIEWVDSADYAPGDEYEAIDAVVSPKDEAAAVVERLRAAITDAQTALSRLNPAND